MRPSPRLVLAGLVLLDAGVLVRCRPRPERLARHLTRPGAWVARVGADRAAVELGVLALWLVAAWLAVGLLAALGARAPGAAGRALRGVARGLLPGAVRRLAFRAVAGAAGLGVLYAPVAATASPPAPVSAVVAHTPLRAGAPSPGPVWPTTATPSPAPRWPTSGSTPRTPAPRQSPTPAPAPTRPHPNSAPDARTVRQGDCLWLLAARRLGPDATDPQVARYVTQLYARNRSVIGDDPDLVRPGQVVHLPAPLTRETP